LIIAKSCKLHNIARRKLPEVLGVEASGGNVMTNPDTGDKISSKKRGDPIKVLRRGLAGPGDEEWVYAVVVANFEAAVTVQYSDGGQEVIPWVSGRICLESQ
jgi:hypothetical protein